MLLLIVATTGHALVGRGWEEPRLFAFYGRPRNGSTPTPPADGRGCLPSPLGQTLIGEGFTPAVRRVRLLHDMQCPDNHGHVDEDGGLSSQATGASSGGVARPPLHLYFHSSVLPVSP